MHLYRHPNEVNQKEKGCVVALGNFDGFHRGHHVVIGEAGRMAREMGLNLAVIVTEPHPISFFQPDKPPFRLTPFRTRAQLLEHFGVDILMVLPFDKTLASLRAQDFVSQVLLDGLDAKHVCVGYDYRFGSKRGGGLDVLRWMGEMEGFGVSVIDPVVVGIDGYAGQVYSSTLVRTALQAGEPRKAAALLGHWWSINGRIIKGDQRGRTIGFPTANIELGECLQPKKGVYAVRAILEDGVSETIYNGVANLGARPTFDKNDILLEVHLFDFDGDVYERHIRVELVSYLREEKKFDSIDALKEQIQLDSHVARIVLNEPENNRNRLEPPTLDQYFHLFPKPFIQKTTI
jgi:riboflavin kinase / FMN adenylyltransferase